MRLRKDAKVELIRQVPLFADCSPKELTEVALLADELALPAGRELTREGAAGREFVVLVEGTAQVRHGDTAIADLSAGDFVGEISLVTGEPRTATVVATSDVDVLVISAHAFRQLMADAPGIREKVERAARERRERA
jgi:CRP/FNR family transcriptional regulator, cyclic AMP receptor protein